MERENRHSSHLTRCHKNRKRCVCNKNKCSKYKKYRNPMISKGLSSGLDGWWDSPGSPDTQDLPAFFVNHKPRIVVSSCYPPVHLFDKYYSFQIGHVIFPMGSPCPYLALQELWACTRFLVHSEQSGWRARWDFFSVFFFSFILSNMRHKWTWSLFLGCCAWSPGSPFCSTRTRHYGLFRFSAVSGCNSVSLCQKQVFQKLSSNLSIFKFP